MKRQTKGSDGARRHKAPGDRTGQDPTEELKRLRQEVESLRMERDGYLKALKVLLPPKKVRFSKEELKELEENGYSLEEILEEMKDLGITQ
jgi:hypothetical protein